MKEALCRIQELALSNIRDNHLLSIAVTDKDVDRCVKAIMQYGLLTPLVVYLCEDGGHMVVSGECELMALRRTGFCM